MPQALGAMNVEGDTTPHPQSLSPLKGEGSRNATPVEPRSTRFAWSQVILASILMLATLPGRTQGLGLVTEPLLADLHLERMTYANLNLWATLLGALLCFPAGWAIDRLGLRWVTAGITLLLGLAVWQLSAFAGSIALLFTLLLATRAFGQSALSVCSITTVGKWFPNRVGMAMGVYSVLLSVFFAVAFIAVGYSVRQNGWRSAWLQIALALIFVITPLVMLALREPQGGTGGSQPAAATSPERRGEDTASHRHSFTLSQALCTGAFWLFAGAAASFNLVSSGLGLFNEAVLAERGFDQKTYHLFLAVSTLMSLVGQFACGWLTTRLKFQILTLAALTLYAVGLAGIPIVHAHWQLWFVAVLLGVSGGMIIVIFFSIWSEAFGQKHLGRIQGAAQMLTVLSSALGPVLFAKCFEINRSYAPLLYGLAGSVLLLAIAAKAVRLPQRAVNFSKTV
jgi:MFS family permease